MKNKPLRALTPLQRHVLCEVRDLLHKTGPVWLTPEDLARSAEKVAREATRKELARLVAAALEHLEKEGVLQCFREFPAGGLGTIVRVTRVFPRKSLEAEARACLLLSKPTKAPHARKIQGQPKHERRGATVSTQPKADSGRAPAPDARGVDGEQRAPGENAHASPTGPQKAPHAVLASPQSANGAGLDPEAPAVETVQIQDPEARP